MLLSFVFKKKAKQTDESSGHAPAPPLGYCDLRNKGVDVPAFGQVPFVEDWRWGGAWWGRVVTYPWECVGKVPPEGLCHPKEPPPKNTEVETALSSDQNIPQCSRAGGL